MHTHIEMVEILLWYKWMCILFYKQIYMLKYENSFYAFIHSSIHLAPQSSLMSHNKPLFWDGRFLGDDLMGVWCSLGMVLNFDMQNSALSVKKVFFDGHHLRQCFSNFLNSWHSSRHFDITIELQKLRLI
jgi:hypothetical protein